VSRFLTLVRHAKSDWGDPSLADFDRPLNGRGERDAAFMAQLLAGEGFRPDLIVSSPARRALATARRFAQACGVPEGAVAEAPSIYEAPPSRIAAVVRETPDAVKHLAVFGHNPGLESLANRLLDRDSIDRLVTCGVVELELPDGPWSALGEECAELVRYRYPKMFPGGR
jgi:phosphohistidine phosphatase